MRKRFYVLVVCFVYSSLFTVYCFAQETPPVLNIEEQKIEERIENLAQTADENTDFTELIENLRYLKKHPINLNNTTREQLQFLGFLNDIQIENLFRHIEKNGKLLALEELQTIDGYDAETISLLLPYVNLNETYELSKSSFDKLLRGKSLLMLRTQRVLETQKGYLAPEDSSSSYYLGNPWKYYARYRYVVERKLSIGITGEKDAGEEFFHGTQSSFDFYSAHLFIRDVGPVKAFALGDYHLEYGQGLTLWTGLAFGKSSEVINIKKNAPGILPYASVTESGFKRGAAVSFGFKKFSLDLFYSNVKLDGNVTDTTEFGETVLVSSLQTSGYHRTYLEVADKGSISEKLMGGHAAYRSNSLNIGATVYKAELSAPLTPTYELYNKFSYKGDSAVGAGVDYSYLWRNISFFGEVAHSKNGAMAYLNGAIIALDPNVTISLLHRHYGRDYYAASWNPFRESASSNERGFYSGITVKPAREITLSASFDAFTFPWLRYQVNAPSSGYEFLSQLLYAPNKRVAMFFQYKQSTKPENVSGNLTPIDYLVDRIQKNYRFDTRVKISSTVTLHNRVELLRLKKESVEPENGYLFLQDINYNPMASPFSFNLRYALFDTKSYDSRIYAYESDLLYVYSIPSYYYRGSRFYAMVQYRVKKGIDIWLRYSQTLYTNQDQISAGSLDEIDGNTKSEIKMQVRFEF
jgi:hypothetical protein